MFGRRPVQQDPIGPAAAQAAEEAAHSSSLGAGTAPPAFLKWSELVGLMRTVWSFSGAADNLEAVARACSAAGFTIVPAAAAAQLRPPRHRTAAPRRGRERPPGAGDDALLAGGRLVGMADLRQLLEYVRYAVLQWEHMVSVLDSNRIQENPRDSKRFQEIPRDSKR